MEFRWGSFRLRFTFGFFAVLALVMLFDTAGVGIPALAAIALHESGHLLAMRLTGLSVVRMSFEPFGLRLERRGLLGYGQEAAVYLGGVAMNALCLLLAWPWEKLRAFALCSAALCFFNLLPVGRLDGGHLLRVCLMRLLSPDRARAAAKVVAVLLLLPMLAGGIWLVWRQGNCSLLLTVGYLAATLPGE